MVMERMNSNLALSNKSVPPCPKEVKGEHGLPPLHLLGLATFEKKHGITRMNSMNKTRNT